VTARLLTVAEALAALRGDKLESVTFTADRVHVATAHGAGSWPRAEWLRGGGPASSQEVERHRPARSVLDFPREGA